MKGYLIGIALLVIALSARSALAAECQGVSFPEQMRTDDTILVLNGVGVRMATFLKVRVYVAALYAPHAVRDGSAVVSDPGPLKLLLQFVRNVSVDDVIKGFNEGFERSAPTNSAALKSRIATLDGWMTDIKKGEQLGFSRGPAGVAVTIAGKSRGVIPGDDFARALFGIWFGPTPPNPELKEGLLGGHCG